MDLLNHYLSNPLVPSALVPGALVVICSATKSTRSECHSVTFDGIHISVHTVAHDKR